MRAEIAEGRRPILFRPHLPGYPDRYRLEEAGEMTCAVELGALTIWLSPALVEG